MSTVQRPSAPRAPPYRTLDHHFAIGNLVPSRATSVTRDQMQKAVATPSACVGNQSGVDTSITRLLVSIKKLLEGLTDWSNHQVSDMQVSDMYVRFGNDFNATVIAFDSFAIDMGELKWVPDDLRDILERCLAEEASPENLNLYLPSVRKIITRLLQGLREKNNEYQLRKGSSTRSNLSSRTKLPYHDSGPTEETPTSGPSVRSSNATSSRSTTLTAGDSMRSRRPADPRRGPSASDTERRTNSLSRSSGISGSLVPQDGESRAGQFPRSPSQKRSQISPLASATPDPPDTDSEPSRTKAEPQAVQQGNFAPSTSLPAHNDPTGANSYSIPEIEEPPRNLTLEELMHQKIPKDLTGKVTVPDFRRPAYGGFALVHKGEWNGRTVAVKVLKAMKNFKNPARWEESMERRLFREIKVWAALSHPNIAEFLGFADDFGDFSAMISTWCHPGTAKDYLYKNESITRQGRIHLVHDVAHGLKYLHGLRIIHGDLKPVARLCDFGLVRLDDWQGPGGMTTTSPYTGTERYKAPELFISIDNTHPVATSEGDVYALGCITLEFVESRLPYERYNHPYQLSQAIARGEPPASQRRGQSEGLWYILDACWESDPNDRPNVDQVVDEIAEVLSIVT